MPEQKGESQSAATIPPMLLPEALGFVPQLLLDDITNIATIAVDDGIQAVEGFLQNWSDSRQSDGANDENWESIQEETENGLVAFTTLLEFHLDNSFDFFGAWCLRNIFAIPPDLPYVLPHHAGLDLTMTPQREQELMDEIESLRSKIENQKRVRRLYKRAILKARAQRRRVERRAEQLSFLSGPTLDTLLSLPDKVKIMQTSIRDLRDVDVSGVLQRLQTTDPGKRQWESPEGFYQWALRQSLEKRQSAADASGMTTIERLAAETVAVGPANQMVEAAAAIGRLQSDLGAQNHLPNHSS